MTSVIKFKFDYYGNDLKFAISERYKLTQAGISHVVAHETPVQALLENYIRKVNEERDVDVPVVKLWASPVEVIYDLIFTNDMKVIAFCIVAELPLHFEQVRNSR